MALSPLGDGEIASDKAFPKGASSSGLSLTAPELFGEDLGALISDAFEKHLPDPSVLVEPAQVYAETLTAAALEKLTPLTSIVRDSVEGVAEARLSLQDQAGFIRSSMEGLSSEINQSLNHLEPLLQRLNEYSDSLAVESEKLEQLQALRELRYSLDQLNSNFDRIIPKKRVFWSWRWRGDR